MTIARKTQRQGGPSKIFCENSLTKETKETIGEPPLNLTTNIASQCFTAFRSWHRVYPTIMGFSSLLAYATWCNGDMVTGEVALVSLVQQKE